ncbi:hypothetical protein LPJ78_002446 [Coemansia sp. RSA 989]|nr:hypothetical protein BX667DRAFT_508773 [Coemansia mojavensis]KAJ1740158.1 hypothetical protein LPJ68_004031 [Coemansia sp. RSA 1086]KAJ1748574.1 hypothetical protein LPJ79_004414 [Coemansia sp. RSA 1821]KAJ1865758.1 hypothetical protein LPJ78_002446 [Coemansia sp. RSA 989]KAJ2648805.1 hypothetical protein IWW40_003605 [Coemansia sp. RSA 1250]KAJ2671413.1 hypothetical protein IWW42_003372 [Coemansia sp. RSA 1085]
MAEYLAEALKEIGVDDEAILEYCAGLLGEETMSEEEKREAISGYLEAVTEANVIEIINKALEISAQEQVQKEARQQQQAKEALAKARELERKELEAAETIKTRQLTSEERRQRENILAKYDKQQLEVVEKNGEAEIVYREVKETIRIEGNNNAKMVAERERAFREKAKLAHQQKVEREKELLEKDRARQEKKRTMKREKRRM